MSENSPLLDEEFKKNLRDHVTGELKSLRSLMERAVQQINEATVTANSHHENVIRLSQQLENLEKTVIRGNGQHGLLTRVALLEQKGQELAELLDLELDHAKIAREELGVQLKGLEKKSVDESTARRTIMIAVSATAISVLGLIINTILHLIKP